MNVRAEHLRFAITEFGRITEQTRGIFFGDLFDGLVIPVLQYKYFGDQAVTSLHGERMGQHTAAQLRELDDDE